MAEDEGTLLANTERVWIVSRPAASGTAYIVRPCVALIDGNQVRFRNFVDFPVTIETDFLVEPSFRLERKGDAGDRRTVAVATNPAAGYHEYTVTVLTTGSPTAEGCSQPGAIIDR